MQLKQLQLNNFRCFRQSTIRFEGRLTLIEGLNGSGKSSVLEALHYLCYLRSFRTATPRDLLNFGQDTFFLKAVVAGSDQEHEIQVGFSGKKRLVKIDNKAIDSYKELMHYYRVITLTEDDLTLIHGGPQERRSYIDQALLLFNPDVAPVLKTFRHAAESRNRALQSGAYQHDYHMVAAEQLWHASCAVQELRVQMVKESTRVCNELLAQVGPELSVHLEYCPKYDPQDSFEQFVSAYPSLLEEERRYGRSLFGAHLDDMSISIKDKRSKQFASRGQQKLVVLLLKVAHIKQLLLAQGQALFLLDDFMTDFDEQRAERILAMLAELPVQLIFTVPTSPTMLGAWLRERGAQVVKLTH